MRPVLILACLALVGCSRSSAPPATSPSAQKPVRFVEVAQSLGMVVLHQNGAKGKKRMPETVGSGVAFFDYDNDGRQDVLILSGTHWPDDTGPDGTPHLFHNETPPGGPLTFRETTQEQGLAFSFYGMGVAVGDYDNDGFEDLYLTAVGPNKLLHNEQGKGFRDVTASAGVVGVPESGIPLKWKWSASAAFFDYDRDGLLDLFVCQYVKWTPERDPFCGHNGVRGYCPPGTFEGAHCTLYRNIGNGRFQDVSRAMGLLDIVTGKSFGIGLGDWNHDGWLDVVVTNDTWANFFLINEQGKRFSEKGVEAGIAFAESGKARAGMGIDVCDYRNNGSFSVAIGNFSNEGLSFFEPEQGLLFTDRAQALGLTDPSLLNVTFAVLFFDYNLDGWPDLMATNGHVDDVVNTYESMLTFRQKPLVFRNEQGKRFTDQTGALGFTEALVGRGAAVGDLDGDGDLELGLVDNGGRFRLYRNDGGSQNHWIRLKLHGVASNRDAIGALVRVRAGGITRSQYVKSAGSFLSESQRALTFGLGQETQVEDVEVVWPTGKTQHITGLKIDQETLCKEEK